MERSIKPPTERIGDIDTNLGSIARQIFSQPPMKPFTNRLGLDHPVPTGEDPVSYHQEILMILMILGAQHLYGDVPIANITAKQFDLMTKYMISFGYVPKIVSTEPSYRIIFEPYHY